MTGDDNGTHRHDKPDHVEKEYSEVPEDKQCPVCFGLLTDHPQPNRCGCVGCGRVFDGDRTEEDGLVQVRPPDTDDRDVDSDDVAAELKRVHSYLDEDPYENPDRWVFFCDDCGREMTAEEAKNHRDDHYITEEHEP